MTQIKAVNTVIGINMTIIGSHISTWDGNALYGAFLAALGTLVAIKSLETKKGEAE